MEYNVYTHIFPFHTYNVLPYANIQPYLPDIFL